MKFRKPFFRKDRKLWYVQLDGKQVNLGPDRAAAFKQYKQLLVRQNLAKQYALAGTPVATILDQFLDWCQTHKAPRTYDWYFRYLQSFVKTIPPSLTVEDLKPFHVQQWVDQHPGWVTGVRSAIGSIQRALTWAARQGHIETNPIRYMEKPPAGRRETLISEKDFLDIFALVKDQEFQDLLELSWETGMRPHELFTCEASFIDLKEARITFPVRLSKGKKVQRVVWLNDKSLGIARRLCLKNPDGPLLKNTSGQAWCVSSVKNRFQDLCRAHGRQLLQQAGQIPPKIPRLKAAQRKDPELRQQHLRLVLARRRHVNEMARQRGTRLNLYSFRHAFITESLVNGIDAVTVSVLAGHRDTAMISRVYSHLTQKHDHMRHAANRARPSSASA